MRCPGEGEPEPRQEARAGQDRRGRQAAGAPRVAVLTARAWLTVHGCWGHCGVRPGGLGTLASWRRSAAGPGCWGPASHGRQAVRARRDFREEWKRPDFLSEHVWEEELEEKGNFWKKTRS